MNDICRLCASVKSLDSLVHINDPNHSIITRISQYFNILLSEEEHLPQSVCTECIQSLDLCVNFIERILQAQDALKQAILYTVKEENNYETIIDLNNEIGEDKNFCLTNVTQEEDDNTITTKDCDISTIGEDELKTIEENKLIYKSKNNSIEDNGIVLTKRALSNLIFYESSNLISLKDSSNDIYHISEIEVINHDGEIINVNNEQNHIEINEKDIVESIPEDSDDNSKSIKIKDEDMIEYINNEMDKSNINIIHSSNNFIEEEKNIFINLPEEDRNSDGTITENAVNNLNLETWDQYNQNCIKCSIECKNIDEWKSHCITYHDKNIKYTCIDCSKVFAKYSTFLNHVTRRHRSHLKYNCDKCYLYYWNLKLLKKHRQQHPNEEKLYTCNECCKSFRSNSALQAHEKSHLPENEKYIFKCEICDKKFGTKPNLLIHKRIHTGIREHKCNECDKSFFQKVNLDKHLLTHLPLRSFVCDICGKSFKTQIRLNNHSTVHSGLKPYQCDICGRQFRERGTLREHNRIHTGAMPFSCEFCGKKFRFKGILTTHRRQHTGERPYSCVDCNHHFTNWPNFNKHMKRRHGINTSVSVRKPQAIPPSGMPPRSKLNHVVPTIHNSIPMKNDSDSQISVEQSEQTTLSDSEDKLVISAADIQTTDTELLLNDQVNTTQLTLSSINPQIMNSHTEEIQQFTTTPIISYLSNGTPVTYCTGFYSIQTVDEDILQNASIQT